MDKEGLAKLQSYYKDSFRCINDALKYDEQGEKHQAFQLYQKGLRYLITGLSIKINGSGNDQEKARDMQEKMKIAKKEVQERIEVLSSHRDSVTASQDHPTANGIADEVTVHSSSPRGSWKDVQELMVLENGVKMFFVSEQGSVTTLSKPQTLYAFQFVNYEPDSQSAPAFLQCAAWTFPMIPGRSPVLNTEPHTYMFPDITIDPNKPTTRPAAPKAFASVGLILSPTITEQDKNRFERILKCYTDFHHYTPLPQDIDETSVNESDRRETVSPHFGDGTAAHAGTSSALDPALSRSLVVRPRGEEGEEARKEGGWSGKVTRGIAIGAELIAWGLYKGAEVGTHYMHKGSDKLRKNLKPNEVPKEVDPKVQENIRHVKNVTGMACQVSGALVSAVSALTVELGRKLAPMIVDHGGKMLPDSVKKKVDDDDGKSTMEDVVKVAVSGVRGFATVFIGLEQSWKLLYKNLQHCTVQTVDHKYGPQVAGATDNAMGAAGYALQTYWNIDNLGVKAIAKRTVKETGKELVNEAGKRLEIPEKPCIADK